MLPCAGTTGGWPDGKKMTIVTHWFVALIIIASPPATTTACAAKSSKCQPHLQNTPDRTPAPSQVTPDSTPALPHQSRRPVTAHGESRILPIYNVLVLSIYLHMTVLHLGRLPIRIFAPLSYN